MVEVAFRKGFVGPPPIHREDTREVSGKEVTETP